jgi:acetyl esterase/lipase
VNGQCCFLSFFRHALTPHSAIVALLAVVVAAETPKDGIVVIKNLPYKPGDAVSPYEKERCKLDVYLPKSGKGFATLVWFHGGGLKGGNKDGATKMARSLAESGLAVVAANYRLSPKARYPAYLQDAAAAVTWTKAHIAEHGGNPKRIFVSGHSAGGYLTLMLGLDPRYLHDSGTEASELAGYIPISGQTMTHYTVREERGIGQFTIIADEAAPVHYARKYTPMFLVLYADHDVPARAEENAYFVAIMKAAGNSQISGLQIADRTHGSIAGKISEPGDPAREAILEFINSPR